MDRLSDNGKRLQWQVRAWWVLKWLVFFVSCWFIYLHVKDEWGRIGVHSHPARAMMQMLESPFFLLVIFLAFFNWGLEALKWKYLVRNIETVGFPSAFRAFFNGITVSFFTPNRSGEFAGRILYLQESNRVRGALLSVVGSSAQLLVTVQAGGIALYHYLDAFLTLPATSMLVLRYSALLLVVTATLVWFRIPWWLGVLKGFSKKPGWHTALETIRRCSMRELLIVWMLSAGRYAVFTLQYCLLLYLVEPDWRMEDLVGLCALSFFLITIIPSIALGELGIRGSVNLAVFGSIGVSALGVLVSTFALWSINIALPALLGAVSVLFLKFSTVKR
jgi:hypothetical protein